MRKAKKNVNLLDGTYTWNYANQEEVTEKLDPYWLKILEELDNNLYNTNQTETRRHLSLQAIDPKGIKLRTTASNPEQMLDKREEAREKAEKLEKLAEYRKRLPKRHQELLNALYNDEEEMTQEEYAKAIGIDRTCVSRQRATALKRLAAYFAEE